MRRKPVCRHRPAFNRIITQPKTMRIKPDLAHQASFVEELHPRPFIRRNVQDDHPIFQPLDPVPVLREDGLGAIIRDLRETRAPVRDRRRVLRRGCIVVVRQPDFAADIKGEDVVTLQACTVRDSLYLVQDFGIEPLQRWDEGCCSLRGFGPGKPCGFLEPGRVCADVGVNVLLCLMAVLEANFVGGSRQLDDWAVWAWVAGGFAVGFHF